MTAYYNENDPYAAQWLRNLIAAGLIAPGDVDDRSIEDVKAGDLTGYTQCHFFAGIGGWSYALRLAGWPDDRPVWTGSCPCQPFSVAGKRKGFDDERHLWPQWFRLIRFSHPPVVFGEQVARAVGQGWLDAVADGMEAEGYAIGSAIVPAAAVAAPHVRERLWFVAHALGTELWHEPRWISRQDREDSSVTRNNGAPQSLANANGSGCERSFVSVRQGRQNEAASVPAGGSTAMADTNGSERHGRSGILEVGRISGQGEAREDAASRRIEWPPEPDLPRVAHGIPARVDKLRAYGNAIVPQVAAEFIGAYMDLERAA